MGASVIVIMLIIVIIRIIPILTVTVVTLTSVWLFCGWTQIQAGGRMSIDIIKISPVATEGPAG